MTILNDIKARDADLGELHVEGEDQAHHDRRQLLDWLERGREFLEHANSRCAKDKCVCGLDALLKEMDDE